MFLSGYQYLKTLLDLVMAQGQRVRRHRVLAWGGICSRTKAYEVGRRCGFFAAGFGQKVLGRGVLGREILGHRVVTRGLQEEGKTNMHVLGRNSLTRQAI